jgi:outer membrane protein TolC
VGLPLTLYTASASISYTFDLFGKNRRELEGLCAAVDYQRFELEAVRLMLAGNVVTAAIEEASLREEIETTRRSSTWRRANSRSSRASRSSEGFRGSTWSRSAASSPARARRFPT